MDAAPAAGSLEQIEQFLAAFTGGGDAASLVVELRVPNAPRDFGNPRTECGFFDLLSEPGQRGFQEAVRQYVTRPPEKQPAGVYATMNPLDPIFLARANNRLGDGRVKISAGDAHVLRRRWLVIDVDPKRPIPGVSATDEEKAAARLVADGVRDDLRRLGWSEPMLCDSGNGYHLWYRIDLPPADGGLVGQLLRALGARHDTGRATVDTGVFNPSRIMKVPGTWARKGDGTPERPHRMARVLEVPEVLEVSRVRSHAG